ncbi:MAG: solute carrier family 23 protein, partial [Bdellovibrionota bacterium]
LTVPQILAAGVIVSVCICLIGLTGAVTWLNRLIPKSVIRGIQLSVGLSLLMKGIQMIDKTKNLIGLDSLSTGIVTFLLVLLSFHFKKIPVAILIFIVGMLISLNSSYGQVSTSEFHLWFPHLYHLQLSDFISAFPRAALPQIPLTLLNSVIAVCALSADLFPDYTLQPKKVAVSVGLMNLVSAWFGGMPMCHGAGGLAGKHRFGARTNGSIIFLGVVKMLLAVLLGGAFAILCTSFPLSILGVMLSFSGLSLALVCRDQSEKVNAFVMLITAGVSLALNHIAIGLVVGLIISLGINKKIFSFE